MVSADSSWRGRHAVYDALRDHPGCRADGEHRFPYPRRRVESAEDQLRHACRAGCHADTDADVDGCTAHGHTDADGYGYVHAHRGPDSDPDAHADADADADSDLYGDPDANGCPADAYANRDEDSDNHSDPDSDPDSDVDADMGESGSRPAHQGA